jgi:hypothetical protein
VSDPFVDVGYPAPLTESTIDVTVEKSISVPFRFDFDGTVAAVEGRNNILRQEMLTLILTYVGERVMMPEYGSHLNGYLWDNTLGDDALFIEELRDLVQTNFPTVTIINMSASDVVSPEDAEIIIQLDYLFDGMPNQVVINTSDVMES